MGNVYLRKGCQLIAGMDDVKDILERKEFCHEGPAGISENASLGLTDRVACLEASDDALKSLAVYRTLRKTTEKQSRWVMHAGCETWRSLFGDGPGGSDTGLFVGLGSIHSGDEPPFYAFSDGNPQAVAATMLRETKPLSGIILLNTTVCSHLATELDITGPLAAFSPHADGGAAAVAESFFSLREGRCSRSLCGGGSQKISPWFFLEYEHLLKGIGQTDWFPAEAAAFIGMDCKPDAADAVLIAVFRSGPWPRGTPLPGLDRFAARLQDLGLPRPEQVVYSGTLSFREDIKEYAAGFLGGAPQFFMDPVVGYAGPASALLAVNFAMELLNAGCSVSQTESTISVKGKGPGSVLVVTLGLSGQANYFLIGKTDET